MYKYVNGVEINQIAFDLDINRVTVSEYCKLFREAICFSVERRNTLIGGLYDDGSFKTVEVDESLFFRRKYNRGRLQNEQWYIGGIERGSKKVFIVPVQNRNAETITRVITENVLPGTKIITDKWRAYDTAFRNMPEYEHESINHSLFFVDPTDDEIHTQNIEGLWSRSKYFLRKKAGITMELQSRYLK
jgi:transposase-like protein